MPELQRKRKLPEKYRSDYILHGDADKVYNKIHNENPSCSIKDMQDTLNALNAELEKLSIEADEDNVNKLLNQLESMNLNDDFNGTKKRRMYGGMMSGMNATALIMYLITDAMKEGAKYGYEQIIKLLAGGLKVLEFLSNKEGCAELVLREYLGKQVMFLIQFVYIGEMVNEVNPMIVINQLAELLPRLIPYVTKGISAGFIGAIGYLVYHFVKYYGEEFSESAKVKLNSLKTTLDALEEATSKDVVKTVISESNNMVEKTKELITELKEKRITLKKEQQENFREAIKQGLTAIPERRIGEFEDVMTLDQLRATIEEPEVTGDGGKKHKKRKTQKRKNKSNKKTIKKSNKSKKHHK